MKHFARFNTLMAAMGAFLQMNTIASRAEALAKAGGYESRGKGGKSPRRVSGIAKVRRDAEKAHNIRKNHRLHR